MIRGNSSFTCVGCDVLVNLGLLIGSRSIFICVGCDVLVNLRDANSCVVMDKSTMYLA